MTDLDTSLSAENVRQALRKIYDPCSVSWDTPLDIVSMGLIEILEPTDGRITIVLSPTTPFCLMAGQIADEIVSATKVIDGVQQVELRVGDSFAWTPDKIDETARAQLEKRRQLRLPSLDKTEGTVSND
jgi:metal-sulfur cluster biosynthetic enzyme